MALNGYLGAMGIFDSGDATLSPLERQIVLLAVSVKNKCEYCTAAHSMLASKHSLDRTEVDNLQQGRKLSDGRLETLRHFTEAAMESRGRIPESELNKFVSRGFTKAQVLEVMLGVAIKTLTNYSNHIIDTPMNSEFAEYLPKWKERPC